jgi:hypothetical protein
MREALFRAAQLGGYGSDEESVARWQDDVLTDRVLAGSFVPLSTEPAAPPTEDPFLLWPYPRGTMHVVDRANCADHFLRANPDFRLITEPGLGDPPRLPDGPLVLFAPFDAVLPGIRQDGDGNLTFAGRRIGAVVNELSLAHLVRHGVLPRADSVSAAGYRPVVTPPRTQLVNGTQLALFKARQMRHVADLADRLAPLGVTALPYASSADRADAMEAVVALLAAGEGVVVRPFGASQGTGVTVVGPERDLAAARRAAGAALDRLDTAVTGKYGAAGAYPVTVTPFVESRKIDGAVFDVRMFVVYDPANGGLRSLPGMVRRAELAFRPGEPLTTGTVLTNFTGAQLDNALPGPRLFPASGADMLARMGLTEDGLVRLGLAASTIWAAGVEAESAQRGTPLPFSYGSVDFLFRQDDGRAVPIEMNGSNVGEHPVVSVHRLDMFAEAMTAALATAGMAGLSAREPAWTR